MKATQVTEIEASPHEVMAVITQFEAYPSFLPDIVSARVMAREARAWEVQFVVELVRELTYSLRLVQGELAPSGALTLSWSLVEGAFRSNTGRWLLEPLNEGRRTKATYEIDVQFGMHVPRTITNSLTARGLPQLLGAFKTRAESARLPAG